jgi:glucose 1-dehydrogenase
MQNKLQDQVAIVTGASSGIGAGCAKELANAGAKVIVNYPVPQGKEMAEKVVAEIAANGGSAVSYKADVSKEDEVQQMFADVIREFGTVDILVNNAGLQKDAPFTEMTLDQWNYF